MTVIRVLLVDDDPMVRSAFTMILSADPEVEVVGEADDGDQVVTAVQTHRPDVIVMDLRMRRVGGVEATTAVRALPDPPHVIAVTSFDADDTILRALDAGARGYLLKDSAPSEISRAIRTVVDGDTALSPRVARYVVDQVTRSGRHTRHADARNRFGLLSAREQQVARGVHAALTNEEIAAQMHLSAATVKTHISHICSRLDVAGRVQIALLVERAGGAHGGAAEPGVSG